MLKALNEEPVSMKILSAIRLLGSISTAARILNAVSSAQKPQSASWIVGGTAAPNYLGVALPSRIGAICAVRFLVKGVHLEQEGQSELR